MNELKTLINVVIRKLGKLVHKKIKLCFFFLIVQVRYIIIETNTGVLLGKIQKAIEF
jgi:hypothetical protein